MISGWRANIGLLQTSHNPVIAPEWYNQLPKEIAVHTSRFKLTAGTIEDIDRAMQDYLPAAELLVDADADVIAFGATTLSLYQGKGYELEVEEAITDRTGLPAVATAAAVRRAFETLGVDSVVVATPYIDELDQAVVEFYEAYGIEVRDLTDNLYISDDPNQMVDLHPASPYQQVRSLDYEDADAIFISCTNYRSFDIIDQLERDTGKPVVTSNQATLWDVLKTIDVDYHPDNLGTLFRDH